MPRILRGDALIQDGTPTLHELPALFSLEAIYEVTGEVVEDADGGKL